MKIVTITDGRWNALEKFANSIGGFDDLIVINNGCSQVRLAEMFVGVTFMKGVGSIARNWNLGIENSGEYWTVVVNDDVVFIPGWRDELWKLIRSKPTFDMFTICHPNSFSGFCISRDLWNDTKFFEGYVGGGYEDEDWFLTLEKKHGMHWKKEVYAKFVYNLMDREGSYLMHHEPTRETRHWLATNLNKPIFDGRWREVLDTGSEVYEGKSGKKYICLDQI